MSFSERDEISEYENFVNAFTKISINTADSTGDTTTLDSNKRTINVINYDKDKDKDKLNLIKDSENNYITTPIKTIDWLTAELNFNTTNDVISEQRKSVGKYKKDIARLQRLNKFKSEVNDTYINGFNRNLLVKMEQIHVMNDEELLVFNDIYSIISYIFGCLRGQNNINDFNTCLLNIQNNLNAFLNKYNFTEKKILTIQDIIQNINIKTDYLKTGFSLPPDTEQDIKVKADVLINTRKRQRDNEETPQPNIRRSTRVATNQDVKVKADNVFTPKPNIRKTEIPSTTRGELLAMDIGNSLTRKRLRPSSPTNTYTNTRKKNSAPTNTRKSGRTEIRGGKKKRRHFSTKKRFKA
jgi:hypothetical protein